MVSTQSVPNVCYCVPIGNCNNNGNNGNNNGNNGNNNGNADGSGNIDIRFQNNNNALTAATTTQPTLDMKIVNNGQVSTSVGSSLQLTSPASSGISLIVNSQFNCQNGLERCCPNVGYQCGMRFNAVANARVPVSGTGQTYYGEHPWLTTIFQQSDMSFQATGALIDHMHVLTVAHKLNQTLIYGQQLVVQLGRWDGQSELFPPQRFSVIRTIVHPQYVASSLRNDVAILRISPSVNLGITPTIGIACLPTNTISNIRCLVAGYGSGSLGGSVQTNLQRQVDLPILDFFTCQNYLRATRLGSNFVLDTGFLCAGAESGKDTCTGDGGAPLVCQIANQWYVVGLTAWGIGCGSFQVPGVYVDVAKYVSWIQQSTRS